MSASARGEAGSQGAGRNSRQSIAAEARSVVRGALPAPDTDVRPEDWVCLAQWGHGLDGLETALCSWSMSRQDPAARRLDRVCATMTRNP
ncbi:hypothetical protein [Streptomyces sp. NPDC000931]|uniref:hypothetical protein n=1 Tax=Streptomyces sp. NPDC000931 TaxID=3154372 RepID=UPI003326A4FE